MATKQIAQQIVVRPPKRKALDIGEWRLAIESADKGRAKRLFDLFEDILLDGTLFDALDKRKDAVTNAQLTFLNQEGREVPEITALMDSLAWEELLALIMKSRFWGRSGFELGFTGNGFSCSELPPKHIDMKKKVILLKEELIGGVGGVSYENNPFIVVLGKPNDYGLLLKAAPWVIYKRGGFGDWAQWIELFGMPQRVGKYDVNDPDSRRRLEEAFEAAGSAPYLVAPSGTEIDKVETSSGNGAAYDDFRRACNEELLITILGQTMTTVQGDKGARSLGEVHQEVEQGKHKSDLRYVERILNQYIKPRLEARGFPVHGGRFTFPDSPEHLEVSELIALSDLMRIPVAYFHERFAIPMADEGEEIARRPQVSSGLGYPLPEDIETDKALEDEITHSDSTGEVLPPLPKAGIFSRLMRFFGLAPSSALGANSAITLPIWTREQIHLADADAINKRVIERVASGQLKRFDPELFEWISNDLIKAVRTAFARPIKQADIPLDTQYQLQNDAFVTSLEVNLFHFSAGKTLSEVQQLNEAFRNSKSYEEFRRKAEGIVSKYNDQWQRSEYNTALLTAEGAANYRDMKSKTNIFPFWEYRTSGDGKVRQEHLDLEGTILPFNDPLWKEIYPPNGWNCRCFVRPLMKHETQGTNLVEMRQRVENYQSSADWDNAKKHGWNINRAEEALVFDHNQQYTNRLAGGKGTPIKELLAEDYGLDPIEVEANRPTNPPINYFEGGREDWDEWHQEHQVLTDYQGRKVLFGADVFQTHTKHKYEARRPKLLHCIPEILRNPDEVWLNDYQGQVCNFNVIKYYDGKCINVVCELDQGKICRIRTWFEIRLDEKRDKSPEAKERREQDRSVKAKKDPKHMYRRGLLIKRRG